MKKDQNTFPKKNDEKAEAKTEVKGLISVIVPVFKVEKYIRKCLDSIVTQTYPDIEIILIDDGSPDTCGEICEEYAKSDHRIKVYHKENGGLSDARNHGIERASGEYFTFVDSDDYLDNDYVEYLKSLIDSSNCKMSICQHRTLYDSGKVRDHSHNGIEVMRTRDCLERMLYHDVIDTSAWAKLYHRSLFDTVKYPKGKIFEDIGTTYRMMVQCEKIAVGYEAKYNYVFHNNSIVNGSFNEKKFDMLDMTDSMAEDVVKIFPDLSAAVLRRRVYARFSTLNQMLNTNNYETERKKIIGFIKGNFKEILTNEKAPKRDKVALILLGISYKLYRLCWLQYQKRLMNNKT